MRRPAITLSGALAVALSTLAHAQAPQPPKAVPEAPAMGGQPQTKPGPQVIGLRANEVALSRLADAPLVQSTKEKLGQESRVLYPDSANQTAAVPKAIGTVTTALLDPGRKAVTMIGVKTGDKVAALPWSQMQPINQPHDELTTTLSPQAIADAPPLADKARDMIDVEQSLIGRSVKSADGKRVGALSDIVVQAKNGTVDYAVVDPGGIKLGTSNAPHAVQWSVVKQVPGNKNQPIVLALNEQQLASAPVFGATMAQETQGSRATSKKAGATEQPPP